MKFDPHSWNEVSTNEEIPHDIARLQLRLSRPAAVFVTAQGVETLAAFGTEIDVKAQALESFRVDTDDDNVRAFVHRPYRQPATPVGEVLTNMDRQPYESGAVLEVRQALRQATLDIAAQNRESRQILQQIRHERSPKPPKPPKGHDDDFVADPSDPAVETNPPKPSEVKEDEDGGSE